MVSLTTTSTVRTLALIAFIPAFACSDSGSGSEDDAADSGDASTSSGETDASGDGSSSGGGVSAEPRDYYEGELSAALGAQGNQARCSTCHSDDGTLEGFSGKSFQDIAFLESYKGGGADLLGAVNACVTGWMGGPALAETDDAYTQLVAFFESISDESVTEANALAPEVLADEAAYEAAYADGDAQAGESKFAAFCGGCHDNGLVVGSTASFASSAFTGYTVGRIAQKVRTSGPPPSGTQDEADSTPGPMPFFEPEELPTQDLADIIAFARAGG